MTRSTNQLAIDKEARMQEAITAVKSKKYTIYTAARVFNVPKRTLHDCVKKNMQPRNLAHECDQNLTRAEETELV